MKPIIPNENLPAGVANRSGFPSHENYDGLGFRVRNPTQAAEFNEMQSIWDRRLRGIGDAVFANGDVVTGGNPLRVEGVEDVNVRVHAGRIYVQGQFYDFPDSELFIPVDKAVTLGVRWVQSVVDETQDNTLLGCQTNVRSYMVGGAVRYKSTVVWGWKADDDSEESEPSDGEFIGVYSVDNGVIIEQNSQPMSDLVYKALKRYDMDGNGSYVPAGLRVSFIEEAAGNYVFQLTAGSAHILGDIVDRKSDSRLTYAIAPDTLTVNNEPHVFTPDTNGRMNVNVSRPPISSVTGMIGRKQKTVTVIRGMVSNTADIIDPAQAAIASIVSVVKGVTTYVPTTDYVLSGDEISWAPGGAEPLAGESYQVTYQYIDSDGVPESVFADYIVVSGYVAGSDLLVTYNYKLPRVDLIVLNASGTVSRILGVPALLNPSTPQAGPNQIAVATIEYNWRDTPRVRNVAVRAVHMSDLEEMRSNIFTLFRGLAEERLRNDANQKDPSAKLGVMVDSFKDDLQRDTGVEQTAAVVDGFLALPIDVEALEILDADALLNHTLPFTPVVAVSQPFATQCALINPYQVVTPPDAVMKLTPCADSWTFFQSMFKSKLTAVLMKSSIASRLDASAARRERRDRQLEVTSLGTEIVSPDLVATETTDEITLGLAIRQREVKIHATGFLPEEEIVEATFDGVTLAAVVGAVATDDGVLDTEFTIPAGIPIGVKLVYLLGSYGTIAEEVYTVGLTVFPMPARRRKRDPLAQTFTAPMDMQVVAADIKFCKKGPSQAPVLVQVREVINGYPGPDVLAEAEITVDDMSILDSFRSLTTAPSYQAVRSDAPTSNNPWGDNKMRIGYNHGSWAYRSLIRPNLPADIVGGVIASATLRIRQLGTGQAFNVRARRLTQSYVMGEVTWNSRATGNLWTSAGGTFATETADPVATGPGKKKGWLSLNVTNIVQQWAGGATNYGMVLMSAMENLAGAAHSAYFDGGTAALDIQYKPAGSVGTVVGDGWTRATFDVPTFVRGGTDYALTLITSDPGHSVSVARMGDTIEPLKNNGAAGLLSRQAHEGVLFDSPNNSTWVPRPREDLTFRILRASYTSLETTVDLGTVEPDGPVTDLMVRAPITRVSGDTQVTFDLDLPGGGANRTVENNETLALTSETTGEIGITATLKGTESLSPILYANPVLVAGLIAGEGTYVTRRYKAADEFNAAVIFKAYLPAGASVKVEVASALYSGPNRVITLGVHQYEWLEMEEDTQEVLDGGFTEFVFRLPDVRGVTQDNLSQIRLTLEGGPAARILLKDFQSFTKA